MFRLLLLSNKTVDRASQEGVLIVINSSRRLTLFDDAIVADGIPSTNSSPF